MNFLSAQILPIPEAKYTRIRYLLVPEGGLEPPYSESCHYFVDTGTTNLSYCAMLKRLSAQYLPKESSEHDASVVYTSEEIPANLNDGYSLLQSGHICLLLTAPFHLIFALALCGAQGELNETFASSCVGSWIDHAPTRRLRRTAKHSSQRASGIGRSLPNLLRSLGGA